jgi:hypothetical protein
VSLDFICIEFYNYNSVKFQDLLVVFGNNFYRKPAGSGMDWVLILNAGTSELKSSNYPSLHRACLLLHLLHGFLICALTDFLIRFCDVNNRAL